MKLRGAAALLVALVAELLYVLGRTWIRSSGFAPIPEELVSTAWRLPFVGLYLWLAIDAVRNAPERTALRWTPAFIVAVVAALAVAPLAGYGFNDDLATRAVFFFTTPIVALREELFYRAILQRALGRVMPPLAAILLGSAAFVYYHQGAQPLNILSVTWMFGIGVLLGAVYHRTRNIWLAVGLHALVDMVLVVSPRVRLIENWPMMAGNLVILAAALAWWAGQRRSDAQGTLAPSHTGEPS